MNFLISQELAQRVVDYLVKQPFIDVAKLNQDLQQLKVEEISVAKTEKSGD